MSYGMFLAGSYKCKITSCLPQLMWFLSQLPCCVVFYYDWFVDFVVGHRDCAAHRTVTAFDVERECYPIATSRYFTQPC